ncbi:hypothetical protein [Glaciecola sp. SC05]|uniref:hypothetical protein n=1 Tax=Glaciecola sp. SC05 TaxID=1987355 RepID=UPI003528279D
MTLGFGQGKFINYQHSAKHYLKKCMVLSACLLSIFVSYENQAKPEFKAQVYYDYRPFSDAYRTQTPANSVAASNLLLLNEISNLVDVRFLPTMRLLTELDTPNNQAVCSLFKLQTSAREKDYYFSLPISFLSNNRLFLRRGLPALSPNLLNDEGEVISLAAIFGPSSTQKIMLWEQISYGETVDKGLNEIPDSNKDFIQVESSHGSLVKMIDRGRTDYAILYPTEIADFEKEFYPLDLLSYPIAGVGAVSTGHLMCNKNQASIELLLKVDKAISALYESSEFIQANTLNISDSESKIVIAAINKATVNRED